MQEALAAYDDAHANPGKYPGDPPHVKDAILKAGHAMADEYRREREAREGRERSGPREIQGLAAPRPALRVLPRALSMAAILIVGLGVGVLIGRATAPGGEETKSGDHEIGPVDSQGHPLRPRR